MQRRSFFRSALAVVASFCGLKAVEPEPVDVPMLKYLPGAEAGLPLYLDACDALGLKTMVLDCASGEFLPRVERVHAGEGWAKKIIGFRHVWIDPILEGDLHKGSFKGGWDTELVAADLNGHYRIVWKETAPQRYPKARAHWEKREDEPLRLPEFPASPEDEARAARWCFGPRGAALRGRTEHACLLDDA